MHVSSLFRSRVLSINFSNCPRSFQNFGANVNIVQVVQHFFRRIYSCDYSNVNTFKCYAFEIKIVTLVLTKDVNFAALSNVEEGYVWVHCKNQIYVAYFGVFDDKLKRIRPPESRDFIDTCEYILYMSIGLQCNANI